MDTEFTVRVMQAMTAAGFDCPEPLAGKFTVYYDKIEKYNRRINLTAITDPEAVIEKHFVDSLLPLKLCPADITGIGADVGTGAGFPGIPLAIMLPETEFVLMDSLKKRLDFLDMLIVELGLKNCHTVHIRAEDAAKTAGGLRESFDFTLSRAVANLSTLSELCLPLVKVGGRMIALKSKAVRDELCDAEYAVSLLGGKVRGVLGTCERNLVIVDKISPTPAIYPRKAGTPEKNPLKKI